MRTPPFSIGPGRAHPEYVGFQGPPPRLGVQQREGLCRGIALLLVLALSCLLIVYAPVVWGIRTGRRPPSGRTQP